MSRVFKLSKFNRQKEKNRFESPLLFRKLSKKLKGYKNYLRLSKERCKMEFVEVIENKHSIKAFKRRDILKRDIL